MYNELICMLQDEWELIFNFVFGYSELIRKCVKLDSDFTISPHLVCAFLSQLSQRFSVYYRKTRILTVRIILLRKQISLPINEYNPCVSGTTRAFVT